MARTTERENIRVEVTAYSIRGFNGDSGEAREIERCEEIARQIRRHIDDIGSVCVTWDSRHYCSHCRAKWTENGDTFNGGCCDEDMKNDPNPEPEA